MDKEEEMKKLIILSSIILLIISLVSCFSYRLNDRGLVKIVLVEQKDGERYEDFWIRATHEEIRLIKRGYDLIYADMTEDEDGKHYLIILCRRK